MKRLLILLFFLFQFGMAYSQIDSAFEANEATWRKKLFEKIRTQPDKELLLDLLENIEQSALHSTIPLKELQYYIEVLSKEIQGHPDYTQLKARIDFTRSIVEMYAGRPERFFEINEETEKQLREKKLFKELFQLNNQLCQFLPSMNYTKEAKAHYYENENLIRELKDAGIKDFSGYGILPFTNAFGFYFESENQIDSAEKYYRLGLERANEANDLIWKGIISGNLGSVLAKKGNYKQAEKLLQVDKEESLKSNQTLSGINAIILLTDIKLSQNNLAEAQNYLQQADSLLKAMKLKDEALQTFYDIELAYRYGNFYLLKGDKSKAVSYFSSTYKKMKALNKGNLLLMNSLNNKRFSFEENVHKVTELEDRSKKRQYILWISLLLLFSLIIILIIQRRFNRQLKEKNHLIQQQKEHLSTLNEQKLKLFSIVAHDMRNPYANLRNLIDLHSDGALTNEEFTEFCQKINLSIHGLNETFENIMNWAKIGMQSGIQILKEQIHFKDLYDEIYSQLEANLSLKGISIKYNELNSEAFYADRNLLLVVLRNLIQNAIKFSTKSSLIELNFSIDHTLNQVQILIRDYGTGMTKQQLDELTEKGTITSSRGTEGEKGGGLGLLITKEFIEAMNGELKVHSKQNEGSTFTVILPYLKSKL